MYLCYIDESGTPEIPGTTSHFILAGLAVPVWHWRSCERDILGVKRQFGLTEAEIHTAWMLRPYSEQLHVAGFERLNYEQRRTYVQRERNNRILQLQRNNHHKRLKQTKKNFSKTNDYIHLTLDERRDCLRQLASRIGNWGFARLFAECIDKIYFDPNRRRLSISEQAFEQLISRFEQFLSGIPGGEEGQRSYGLLIHDNNQTVAKKHTQLMKHFHETGTFWTQVQSIIETPLFVDSQLTGMVQIADLCAYALRRYVENGEEDLFDRIFQRADRRGNITVGIRHFTDTRCRCTICQNHTNDDVPRQRDLI